MNMKTKHKQMMIALVMVLIFGFSSIAFIASSLGGQSSTTGGEIQPLTSSIIEDEIDFATKNAYIQGGFTFLTYYSNGYDFQFDNFLNNLPQQTALPSGQTQLFIVKAEGSTNIQIESMTGFESLNDTDSEKVFEKLCGLLSFTPVECALMTLNETTSGIIEDVDI